MFVHTSQADIMPICSGAASKCPDDASQPRAATLEQVQCHVTQSGQDINIDAFYWGTVLYYEQAWKYNDRVSHLEGLVCIEV